MRYLYSSFVYRFIYLTSPLTSYTYWSTHIMSVTQAGRKVQVCRPFFYHLHVLTPELRTVPECSIAVGRQFLIINVQLLFNTFFFQPA